MDPTRASAVAERASHVDLGQIEIAEVQIPELYDAPPAEASPADLTPLAPEQLARLTVRLVKPAGWKEVWTSKGTGGARASVWAPSLGGGLASSNKARLCLGHHASTGLDAPRGPLVLELHDTSKNGMQTSEALPRAQAQLLPHPLSYRQVWSRTAGGAQPLFVWRPLPPSAAFVALGYVATSTAQPPPLEAVRCLCRAMHVPGARGGCSNNRGNMHGAVCASHVHRMCIACAGALRAGRVGRGRLRAARRDMGRLGAGRPPWQPVGRRRRRAAPADGGAGPPATRGRLAASLQGVCPRRLPLPLRGRAAAAAAAAGGRVKHRLQPRLGWGNYTVR